MTGAREGRSDGGNKQQQESGPALFPRLHVAETKKAGPRGPPRNKMALYEQLTIPSHKFKPSPMPLPSTGRTMKSPSMTTPLYLPIPQLSAGSHDSMYSYVPMSYMNPTMMSPVACIPVMNMGLFNADAVTSSMNTSGSKSTIMDGAIESPVFGGGVTCMPGHSKHHAPTEKGRGDDDFEVPTYSSATQSSGQTRPSSPLSPLYIQKAPQGQRALPRINKESVIQKRSPLLKGKTREVASVEHKDDGRWSTASGECVTLSITGNDVDSQEADHRELERIPSSESSPATAPTDKVCRTDSLTAPSEQDMFSNISLENQSGEGSEPSQQRRGSSAETGSSMLENVPADSVQFQDVVSAFGQQEFWKTQMIMIRQQRIFSRQVFELHRVIEVQQLLAKTLCTSSSIDEALEKEDDNVHMPGSPVAEVPEVPQAESPKLEVLEVPVIAAEPVQVPDVAKIPERRPETNENSGPIQEAPRQPVYPLSVPTQQVFNPEVPWQAPPYAAWGVRMASPFMYVPYPGPYPPGYGTYPVMGAPLPMYAQPGALQQPVRFPTWQQPGMPPLLSAQGSAAVPAWYAQQSVPVVSPAASRGIASPLACHVERFAPSESGQSVESTLHMADARQAGQGGARLDVGVNRNEGNSGETSGRAKGWSRKEGRWVRGDRNLFHKQQASDVADLRGNKANYQNGDDTARGGGDHNLGRACGQQQTNESYPVVEQATTGATTTHVAPQEGTSLKHMRSEGDFGPGACRWFPILSPAKRPMHHSNVIKVLPRAASATPELAANILLSIQTDRRR